MRRWVQQAERDQGSRQDGLRTSEREELSRLRRENRQLKLDREILQRQRPGSLGRPIRPVTVFEFVRANQGRYRIARMCRLLGVSTSGYYAWRVRSPSRRAQQNKELSRRIAAIHAESRQTYGARRVWAELRAQGVTVSRRRVARLMRALGLQGVTRRKRRCTTRRDPQATVAPDRVQRRFEASEPNRLWVADITYVPTLEGFVYLATVLDVFSRKVVGWAMSARQTVDLVQSALEMAVTARAAQGVVLHSDRAGPLHGRARGLLQGFQVERAGLAPGAGDHPQQASNFGTDFVLDRAQGFFSTAPQPLQQTAWLGLDGAQAADPFVDGHQVRAQLLEAAELGNLAVGLAALGRIGQGLLDGLAAELVRETHLGAVAGMVVLGAGAVGFAAAAEGGMDGTGAEVAELGDCEQELGAALFQGGQGIGHGASFVWCTKYPQISEAKPTARLLRHNHVAHPQKSQKLTSKLTSFIL